jgi:hypothetical protein
MLTSAWESNHKQTKCVGMVSTIKKIKLGITGIRLGVRTGFLEGLRKDLGKVRKL